MIQRCILILLMFTTFPMQAAEIRVAAAANLRYVLPELASVFEKQTGHQLAISYAASGTLTTQILHGAPFDVFLSANTGYIDRLITAKFTEGAAINFAQAQLALFTSNHSSLKLDDGLNSLKLAMQQGRLSKAAIANPKHAPYGQVAQKVLENAGLWKAIQAYLLTAENAAQVVQFSLSSSVDVGFVPYSIIAQPEITSQGSLVLLDLTLPQYAILVKGAEKEAEQFFKFIEQPQAKTIFLNYGFL